MDIVHVTPNIGPMCSVEVVLCCGVVGVVTILMFWLSSCPAPYVWTDPISCHILPYTGDCSVWCAWFCLVLAELPAQQCSSRGWIFVWKHMTQWLINIFWQNLCIDFAPCFYIFCKGEGEFIPPPLPKKVKNLRGGTLGSRSKLWSWIRIPA